MEPDVVANLGLQVWEQDVVSIVMTTGLVEGGSTKCAQYWPEQGQTLPFGSITVTTTKKVEHDGFTAHTLKLSQRGSGVKQAKHFWFHSWPDHGTMSFDIIFAPFLAHFSSLNPT